MDSIFLKRSSILIIRLRLRLRCYLFSADIFKLTWQFNKYTNKNKQYLYVNIYSVNFSRRVDFLKTCTVVDRKPPQVEKGTNTLHNGSKSKKTPENCDNPLFVFRAAAQGTIDLF